MTIQYLTHAYDQLDEQSTPVLRGVWKLGVEAGRNQENQTTHFAMKERNI